MEGVCVWRGGGVALELVSTSEIWLVCFDAQRVEYKGRRVEERAVEMGGGGDSRCIITQVVMYLKTKG